MCSRPAHLQPTQPPTPRSGSERLAARPITLTDVADALAVWIDQDECTGDGLCVQYAPEVFEFDIDGLAYVKDGAGELRQTRGARVPVPAALRLDVIDSARECPGTCIHLVDGDGVEITAS
jgi:ferredoxin